MPPVDSVVSSGGDVYLNASDRRLHFRLLNHAFQAEHSLSPWVFLS